MVTVEVVQAFPPMAPLEEEKDVNTKEK